MTLGLFRLAVTATIVGAVSGPAPVSAEEVGAFWQSARDRYNQMSDDACDGNSSAFRELMQAAIMEEHPVAQNDLAWVFGTERCQYYANDVEAVAELQLSSADAGYPVAQNNIAVKFMEGTGVTQNTDLAIDYFEAAIRAGYGKSAARLGVYFAEGIYVERNIARAEQLLEDAYFHDADPSMIAELADALDVAVVGTDPAPEPMDRWAYYDGEASWDLVQNGALLSSVFVGRDQETGDYYYGLYRVSDDPMIHFMGAAVSHANGSDTDLDINGCGAQNCLIDYGDSAQVRIPISRRNQAAMLEAFKAGSQVKFRYQTEASYAVNQFKTMTMGLKGSRKAIEDLERLAPAPAVRVDPPGGGGPDSDVVASARPAAPAPAPVPTTPVPTVQAPTYTGGPSYYHENTSNGDIFCAAEQRPDYSTGFYNELTEIQQNSWLNSLTGNVKPAATEYLTTATTAWQSGLHSSSSIMVFYKNGAVKELQNTARDGVFDIYDVLSGSWQIEDGRGIVMNLRSKWKYYSSGYDHFQCTGGSVALDRAYGPRDGNANSSWQTCSIQFNCERWSDNFPEKKSTSYYGSLVEWAPGDVAPKQMIWTQKQLELRRN